MNRKFALFLGLVQIAPYAAGAGLKEIYRGTDIWFDGDRLLQQVGSRVSILDLKTTEPVFKPIWASMAGLTDPYWFECWATASYIQRRRTAITIS